MYGAGDAGSVGSGRGVDDGLRSLTTSYASAYPATTPDIPALAEIQFGIEVRRRGSRIRHGEALIGKKTN